MRSLAQIMLEELGANHVHVLTTEYYKIVQGFLLYALHETLNKGDDIRGLAKPGVTLAADEFATQNGGGSN